MLPSRHQKGVANDSLRGPDSKEKEAPVSLIAAWIEKGIPGSAGGPAAMRKAALVKFPL